jgi:hypothetical protein
MWRTFVACVPRALGTASRICNLCESNGRQLEFWPTGYFLLLFADLSAMSTGGWQSTVEARGVFSIFMGLNSRRFIRAVAWLVIRTGGTPTVPTRLSLCG